MFTAYDLKKAMNLYKEKTNYANYCNERFEANPFDEEIEAAADKAYEEQFNAYTWVVRIITKMINVDEKTARVMVSKYQERITALCNRLA